MENNFSKYILEHGGFIKQLELPVEMSEGLGMCNPSVFIDKDGKLLCNIRRVNYLFHLSLTNRWNSAFGPTNYHHPDDDNNLRTENYMCELDENLNIIEGSLKHVEYQPYEPKWGFVGEEDVRIVRWNDKLYLTGCRRDTDTKGTSRMELSEIDSEMHEVSRTRVPAPGNNGSYCEKNWMAVLDEPYRYVKWCNPVEVVEYDPATNTTRDVVLKDQQIASDDPLGDIRGSSQVITVDDLRIAIVHEVALWTNRYSERSATYYTRFIVWDKDWNTLKLSPRLWFMNDPIEFTNGFAFDGKDFIIPFSESDNAAFIAKIGKNELLKFIGFDIKDVIETGIIPNDILYEYILDIFNPEKTYDLGYTYYMRKQYASAHAFFIRSAELAANDHVKYKRIGYDAYYMAQKCMEGVGGRKHKMLGQYNILIQWDPDRYEAYYEMSRIYYGAEDNFNQPLTALGFISTAVSKLHSASPVRNMNIDRQYMLDRVWMHYGVCCYRCAKDYEAIPVLKDLLENGSDIIKEQIKSLNIL